MDYLFYRQFSRNIISLDQHFDKCQWIWGYTFWWALGLEICSHIYYGFSVLLLLDNVDIFSWNLRSLIGENLNLSGRWVEKRPTGNDMIFLEKENRICSSSWTNGYLGPLNLTLQSMAILIFMWKIFSNAYFSPEEVSKKFQNFP